MSKKRGKRPKSNQYKFRRTTFPFHQYWNISYTERFSNLEEQDFSVFIKAKSYDLAKKILREKVAEDNPGNKAIAIQGYMFHKDYKTMNARKLTFQKWELIRSASFPNIHNILYKHRKPRAKGKLTRWHYPSSHLSPYCYKKGHLSFTANKFKKIIVKSGKLLVSDEWVEQKSFDFTAIKKAIIDALIANNNMRTESAVQLGIDRSVLNKWMKRIKDVNWQKEYPPQKQIPPILSREDRLKMQAQSKCKHKKYGATSLPRCLEVEEKRLLNSRIAQAKKADAYRRSLVPKIADALSVSNNVRAQAAKYLGVNPSTFKGWLARTKYLVDWANEYPSNPFSK